MNTIFQSIKNRAPLVCAALILILNSACDENVVDPRGVSAVDFSDAQKHLHERGEIDYKEGLHTARLWYVTKLAGRKGKVVR